MIRVDAHLHVWRLDRGDHDWITPDLPIHRDHGLEDVRPFLEDITAAVLIQSAPTEAETAYLLDVASQSDGLVRGVVGWTDLMAPDAPARIASLAKNPLLKGLRPMLRDIKDTYWILRDEVKPALRAMTEAGLCFDALIQARHLPLMPMLRMHHPDLKIVINNAAEPPVAARAFQPWADNLRRLADETDIYCKLSGISAKAGPNWMMNDLKPWVDHVVDSFGPSRVMWGSDWPVLNLTSEYVRWYRIITRFLFRFDIPQRDEIMGGTAVEFYGLT